MTPQEAIETIKIAIAEVEWDYPMDYTVAFEAAIDALQKVEAYERFIEYFVFEGGYGDYSAMCEYMTRHNDTWCSEHCRADKPDIECVVKWSEEEVNDNEYSTD